MRIAKINNSNDTYFGTRVFVSPKVVDSFFSNEIPRFRKQINLLENNGIDDVLLLFKTSYSNVGAELYCNKDGRLINSHLMIEEPIHADKNRRSRTVNIVALYNKASESILPVRINDKRHGLRVNNWIDYIPGIEK